MPLRPLEELEREICELSAHIAAASCRRLVLLAEWDDRRGWAEWGVRSCAQWLSWRCSIAPGAAREQVRVAHRLTELPLVREAFGAGELSYCKARALTRVATAETEAELVEIARHATGAQLEKLVRGYRGALSATLDAAKESFQARTLSCSWEDDGSLRIRGRLAAEDGALLLAALEQAKATNLGDVPATVQSADALVSMARSALAADGKPRSGGEPCQIVVHVDVETLATDTDVAQDRSELERGPALAPETVRRLACDASIVRIVERDGVPLSVGRRTRTIRPGLRRALQSRDRGCRFPGCTHERFLHAHHIQHWASGGPTELDNLVQLCSYHHRLIHEGGFSVQRRAGRRDGSAGGGLRFLRPDGRVIPPVGGGARARGRSLVERQRAAGLAVDADTCTARSAGQSLDYGLAVEVLLARALAGT
jgi:Domain of unknown function (DUF222)/HNH endonuclease